MCDMNAVEDEFHFLCKCPYYDEIRNPLYNFVINKTEKFVNMSDNEKFIHLMTSSNQRVGKFLKLAWEKRKQKLFN